MFRSGIYEKNENVWFSDRSFPQISVSQLSLKGERKLVLHYFLFMQRVLVTESGVSKETHPLSISKIGTCR